MSEIASLVQSLGERLDLLTNDLIRLASENSRLRSENESLREQLVDLGEVPDTARVPVQTLPVVKESTVAEGTSRTLYERLPPVFAFNTFFSRAESLDLSDDEAKVVLRDLLNAQAVTQRGSLLFKQHSALLHQANS